MSGKYPAAHCVPIDKAPPIGRSARTRLVRETHTGGGRGDELSLAHGPLETFGKSGGRVCGGQRNHSPGCLGVDRLQAVI